MTSIFKVLMVFVTGVIVLAAAESNEDTDVNAVLRRSKQIAENSEENEVTAMRQKEEEQEKEMRLHEETEEKKLAAATMQREHQVEQNLKEAQEGQGAANLVDVVARQAIQLAELQHNFQETQQRLQERLKETEHRLAQTQKHVKKIQDHWRSTAETIDRSNNHRQKDQDTIENVTGKVSNITSSQKDFQANAVDPLAGLAKWIKQTDMKLKEANKKITNADQDISTANQKISTANQKISTANQRITTAEQKITNANQKITTANQNIQNLKSNTNNRIQDLKTEIEGLRFRCESGVFICSVEEFKNSATFIVNKNVRFNQKFSTKPSLIIAMQEEGNAESESYPIGADVDLNGAVGVNVSGFGAYCYSQAKPAYVRGAWMACGHY